MQSIFAFLDVISQYIDCLNVCEIEFLEKCV